MAAMNRGSVSDSPAVEPTSTKRRQLSQAEVRRFVEDGYLIVRRAFSGELARQLVPIVWSELEIDEQDRSTWKTAAVMLKKILERPPFPQVYSERYRNAVDELCGRGRWSAGLGVGHWLVLLPGFAKPLGGIRDNVWHVDISLEDPHIDAPEFGLLNVELFSDVDPGGGGTAIRVGSHAHVARIIQTARELRRKGKRDYCRRILSATKHLPVIEATGQAGDVLMMHPFTVHAVNANLRDRARIAAVKLIRIDGPLNLKSATNGDPSPVETAIVN